MHPGPSQARVSGGAASSTIARQATWPVKNGARRPVEQRPGAGMEAVGGQRQRPSASALPSRSAHACRRLAEPENLASFKDLDPRRARPIEQQLDQFAAAEQQVVEPLGGMRGKIQPGDRPVGEAVEQHHRPARHRPRPRLGAEAQRIQHPHPVGRDLQPAAA